MTSLQRHWPVLLLCCVLGFDTMSFPYGLGALFTDIMDTYGVSRATASLVQSVCIGLMFLIGIFTGHFLQRFGPRVTVITGSVLATVGCVIAFFATHIVHVIVGIGVFGGMGISLNFLTALTLAGTVFPDIKSLALSVHSICIAVGCVVYPLLLTYVTKEYSLRGTFLILAAINCQMILCGALIGLFIPRTPGKTVEISEPSEEEEAADEADVAVDLDGDEERLGNLRNSGDASEDWRCSGGESLGEERESFLADHKSVVDNVSLSCRLTTYGDQGEEDSHSTGLPSNISENIVHNTKWDSHIQGDIEPELDLKIQEQNTNHEESGWLVGRSPEGNIGREHTTSFTICQVGENNKRSVGCFRHSSLCQLDKIRMFSCAHIDIFRNVRFVIFALFASSSNLYIIQPLIFMTDMVRASQLTAEDGSFFLTVIFVGNVLGRGMAGLLYRLLRSGTLLVYSVSIATGGVTCLFYLFTREYSHFVVVSFFLGLSLGLLSANVPMVYLEILGPGRYGVGLGYVSTVEGVFLLLAGPYGGLVRDMTDSYRAVYYIAAVHGLALGILLVFTALRFRQPS